MQPSGRQVGLHTVDNIFIGCHACLRNMYSECSVGNDGEKKSDSELRG